jgi:hypothetical protein
MDALSNASPDAAIERFVQNNQWDKVFEVAKMQGQDSVNKYATATLSSPQTHNVKHSTNERPC